MTPTVLANFHLNTYKASQLKVTEQCALKYRMGRTQLVDSIISYWGNVQV